MAGRISEYTALTASVAASTDLLEVLDVSDTSMAPTGTNKKMTLGDVRGPLTNTHGVMVSSYRSGCNYPVNGIHAAVSGQFTGSNTGNTGSDKCMFVPFVVSADVTVAGLGINVGAVGPGTGNGALAIFDSTFDVAYNYGERPNVVIRDYGTFGLTSGGLKYVAGTPITLSAFTMYWASYGHDYVWNGNGPWHWTTSYHSTSIVTSGNQWIASWTYPNFAAVNVVPNSGWHTPWIFFKVA